MSRPGPLRRLVNALLFVAALVLLAEEWLWDSLQRGMRVLAQWAHVVAFERWLQSLPPWPALAMMLVPTLVLVPFKFAGMWALAHHHWLLGVLALAGAKVAGMAVAAFVFANVKDAARKLAWFDRFYLAVTRALAWARAWLHAQPVYWRVRRLAKRMAFWARHHAGGDRSGALRRWSAARRLARARRQGG